MDDPDGVIYRLARLAEVPDDAWRTRLDWTALYKGVAGLDDHFLHCSTAEQAIGTAAAYFAGATDVVLLAFSVSLLREADLEVRWEDAAPTPGVEKRDGDFPHVYGGAIPYACLAAPPAALALGPDGKHLFPMFRTLAAALDTSSYRLEANPELDGIDGDTAEEIREQNEATEWEVGCDQQEEEREIEEGEADEYDADLKEEDDDDL